MVVGYAAQVGGGKEGRSALSAGERKEQHGDERRPARATGSESKRVKEGGYSDRVKATNSSEGH